MTRRSPSRCEEGHTEIATALIAAGADIDTWDGDVDLAVDGGYTPLLLACEEGSTSAELIARGAKVNQAADDGATPLIVACRNGHTEIAAELLADGAEVNQAADDGAYDGATPLYWACRDNRLSTVQKSALGRDSAPRDRARCARRIRRLRSAQRPRSARDAQIPQPC